MKNGTRKISLLVAEKYDGKSVALILKDSLHISETILRHIRVANAGITLDGTPCRTDAIAHTGQTICIDVSHPDPQTSIEPEPGNLTVIYEDADLLVLDKEAGLVVHPSRGHWTGTLCNYVAHHLASQGEQPIPHPVNRLDRETTGLVVFAKHAHAQNRLQEIMHTPQFERSYLAICTGTTPAEGVIDAPIARIRDEYGSFGVRDDGKHALTRFTTLSSFSDLNGEGELSLVRLTLETGRTHQIRVHMSHLGHPLLGDTAYGSASQLIDRPALHSWRVRVNHPVTNELLRLEAPLPADMARLVPNA